MRKTVIRSVSMIGILLVLFAALIAVVRFYPYTYNFPAYPKITHTRSGAAGDPINLVFVGTKDQIMHSFQEADAAFTPPILSARNGGGDYYASDGDVLVINYTQSPIPLNQPAWGIEGLKNRIFLFYDTLFTVLGVLIAFLVLAAVLSIGLVLWRLMERNRTMVRK